MLVQLCVDVFHPLNCLYTYNWNYTFVMEMVNEGVDCSEKGRTSRAYKKISSMKRSKDEMEQLIGDKKHNLGPSTMIVEDPNPAVTSYGNIISCSRFLDSFYDVPCDQLAKNLLGHVLVRQLRDGKLLKGKIVETECYPGGDDRTSHSFQGKLTERNAPMYMKPGTTYVYFTYGMYHCFNISSQGPGAAVLLRAIEPLDGMDYMQQERNKKRKVACTLKPHQLANGPSKLCISMSIEKESCNAQDICSWSGMWIEKVATDGISDDSKWLAAVEPHRVVATSRIGITSCGSEWASKPYRFYVLGNTSVSQRDKVKEKEIVSLVQILERKRQRMRSPSQTQ